MATEDNRAIEGGSAKPVYIVNSTLPSSSTSTVTGTRLATDYVQNGTSLLTPKWAVANVAQSQTDSSIVAAVAGKRIRVLALAMLTAATATNVTFNTKGGGAGTAISCLFANGANQGAVLGPNTWGWFQTGVGEALTVTTGAGSTTGIHVQYIEV